MKGDDKERHRCGRAKAHLLQSPHDRRRSHAGRTCQTIVNDLPNRPLRAAILSDSKLALQALAAGETRNRGNLQAEILFLAHQLILKGSDVFLMWLPSHTGIKGK